MPEITEEEIRLLTRRWVRLQDEADAYSDGMGSARTQEEATAARVMLELAKRARETR